MRLLSCVGCCALFAALAPADDPKPAPWVTLKGRVVFPEKLPIPVRAPLAVNQDKGHCLAKGPILDETVIVNPKTRGIRNVVVWLRPDNNNPKAEFTADQIHPNDAKRKPADVVIDQPCCMFVERVTACRVGDTIVVKNPAPVNHNFFWVSEANGELNVTLAPNGQHRFEKPLAAEPSPIGYKCTIHPWMAGWVRVFDHPYYAVTDDDGKFEIKNAPAGKFRVVMWHEVVGFKGGRNGRLGETIEITGDDAGVMEAKPTEFDVTAK